MPLHAASRAAANRQMSFFIVFLTFIESLKVHHAARQACLPTTSLQSERAAARKFRSVVNDGYREVKTDFWGEQRIVTHGLSLALE